MKVELLNQYAGIARKMKEVVCISQGNVTTEAAELAEQIEYDMDRVIQYLHEEALSELASFNKEFGRVLINDEAIDQHAIRYYKDKTGELVLQFPIWLFYSRSKDKNIRPNHHGGNFLRASQFWDALVQHLIPLEDRRSGSPARPVINPVTTCDLHITVYRYLIMAPDFDKIDVGYFANSLASANVISSDHPSELNVVFTYKTVSKKTDECLIVRIKNRN